MIASATRLASAPDPNPIQAQFLKILPTIRRYARKSFRHLRLHDRADMVAEVVALAWRAFVRLVERGRDATRYALALARYSVKQCRSGRRAAGTPRRRDLFSGFARRNGGHSIRSIDNRNRFGEAWRDILVDHRQVSPADRAATRIDIGSWLAQLPDRQQRIARALASGRSTGETAKRFGVSAGRISQIRAELADDWQRFQGEPAVA